MAYSPLLMAETHVAPVAEKIGKYNQGVFLGEAEEKESGRGEEIGGIMDFGPSLLDKDLLKDSLTRKDMGISWDAATGMTTGFADPLSYVENRFAAATPRSAGVEAGVGVLWRQPPEVKRP